RSRFEPYRSISQVGFLPPRRITTKLQERGNRFMRRGTIARVLTIAAVSVAVTFGQSFQGGIRGTVSDSSGAAIDVAKLTLTDEGTGITRSTISGSGGEYAFTAINPATYKITVEKPGFKIFERKGITVGT